MAESMRKSFGESEKDMAKVTTTEEGTAVDIRWVPSRQQWDKSRLTKPSNNLAKQEKNLRWKLDLYILPWVTLLYRKLLGRAHNQC